MSVPPPPPPPLKSAMQQDLNDYDKVEDIDEFSMEASTVSYSSKPIQTQKISSSTNEAKGIDNQINQTETKASAPDNSLETRVEKMEAAIINPDAATKNGKDGSDQEQDNAAIMLQKVQRGKSVRKEEEKKSESASKIQAIQRGKTVRKEEEKKSESASKIQAIQRGKSVRKEEEKKSESASKIQAIQRGNTVRKETTTKEKTTSKEETKTKESSEVPNKNDKDDKAAIKIPVQRENLVEKSVPPMLEPPPDFVILPPPHHQHHHHKDSSTVKKYMAEHPEWKPHADPMTGYLVRYKELQDTNGETGVTVAISQDFFTTLMLKEQPSSKIKPDLKNIFTELELNNKTDTSNGITKEDWSRIVLEINKEKKFIHHTYHAFKKMDKDKDGSVTVQEAVELLVGHAKDSHLAERITKETSHLEQFCSSDGKLTFPDFIKMILLDREEVRKKRKINQSTNKKEGTGTDSKADTKIIQHWQPSTLLSESEVATTETNPDSKEIVAKKINEETKKEEKTIEKTKEEMKEKTKEDSKEEMQKDPKEKTKEETKEEMKEDSKDNSKEDPKLDNPKDNSKENNKEQQQSIQIKQSEPQPKSLSIPPQPKPPDTKEDNAATKLQAIQRGNSTRKEADNQQVAATKLQAIQRGKATRDNESTILEKATNAKLSRLEEKKQEEDNNKMFQQLKAEDRIEQEKASNRLYNTKVKSDEKKQKFQLSMANVLKLKKKTKKISRKAQASRDQERYEKSKKQIEKRKQLALAGRIDPEASFVPTLETNFKGDFQDDVLDDEEKKIQREKRFNSLHEDGEKKKETKKKQSI